jgi:uncharacterized protein (DUF302 family)
MLYERETKGTVADVVRRIEAAAADNKFGVMGTHNLKERMAAKGVAFGPECQVVEVCNPGQAKTVLEANMAIATALPCRISVYQQGGKVKVATLRPTALLNMFGNPELAAVAKDVEQTMIRIIDAACRE